MLFLLIAMIAVLLIVVSILGVLYYRLKIVNKDLNERLEEADEDRAAQVQWLMEDLADAERRREDVVDEYLSLERYSDRVHDERANALKMLEMVLESGPRAQGSVWCELSGFDFSWSTSSKSLLPVI